MRRPPFFLYNNHLNANNIICNDKTLQELEYFENTIPVLKKDIKARNVNCRKKFCLNNIFAWKLVWWRNNNVVATFH